MTGLVATACSNSGSGDEPAGMPPTVFAHYMLQFPLSLDNLPATKDYYATQWLTIGGEENKHVTSGGYLRDRPLPVTPGADFLTDNYVREFDQARAAGNEWQRFQTMLTAADGHGFRIIPTVDAVGSLVDSTPEALAEVLAPVFRHPCVSPEGEDVLLSSFAAEKCPVAWWTGLRSALAARIGREVTFHAVLLEASTDNITAFAPIASAIGSWGGRTPEAAAATTVTATHVRQLGRRWIAPVAAQDVRPRNGLYAEACNTETFRAAWAAAHASSAEFVQLITWNDYSESTHLAPSVNHSETWTRLNRILLDSHRTSTQAVVDQVFLTYRVQAVAAQTRVRSTAMSPSLGGAHREPRDSVEVLTLLAAPSAVMVTQSDRVARYTAPQGLSARLVELREGTIDVSLKDGCVLRSHQRIVARPSVQDLSYHGDWLECR